ncbi:MAG: DbpA RNA binding domain-containing protein, partial [Oleibacter sp.]|nr:DbpA RNA binding domain-containing protein [Thalassolituus sp.]
VGVGYDEGLRPGNLVGAIANEADLESRFIGHIEILDSYSIIDLPAGMPAEVMKTLRKAKVCGKALEIRGYNPAEVPENVSIRPPRPNRAPRRDSAPSRPHRGKTERRPSARS